METIIGKFIISKGHKFKQNIEPSQIYEKGETFVRHNGHLVSE
jgi:hypothetical protein